MKSAEDLDYVIIYDGAGRPQKRPRNKFYALVAAKQAENKASGRSKEPWPPLIKLEGEPLSHTILRERGEYD